MTRSDEKGTKSYNEIRGEKISSLFNNNALSNYILQNMAAF